MKTVPPKTPHVLHLICSLHTGGAERLLIDLFRTAQAGQTGLPMVAVVLNASYDPRLVEELRKTGAPVHLLERRPGNRNPAFLLELVRLIRRYNIALVHTHDLGGKIWAGVLKFIRPGLKTVFTMHTTGIAKKYSASHRLFHSRAVDQTLTISSIVDQECRDSGLKSTTLIHNGVDIDRFRQAVPAEKHHERPVIINVARYLHSQKGQDIFIRAIRKCADRGYDLECRLVGSVSLANPGSLEYLKNLVTELALEKQVFFLENRLDIPDLLGDADIFVLPSRIEGFGLAVIEAMAAGVPVIAADTGGPAELIESGHNGLLFSVESEDELAESIIRLVEDRDLREKLAAEATVVADRFDIGTMAGHYDALYRKLTGNNRPAAH